jgi:hypothetical protein
VYDAPVQGLGYRHTGELSFGVSRCSFPVSKNERRHRGSYLYQRDRWFNVIRARIRIEGMLTRMQGLISAGAIREADLG